MAHHSQHGTAATRAHVARSSGIECALSKSFVLQPSCCAEARSAQNRQPPYDAMKNRDHSHG